MELGSQAPNWKVELPRSSKNDDDDDDEWGPKDGCGTAPVLGRGSSQLIVVQISTGKKYKPNSNWS